ncbi:MAG: hypothetical protein LBE75_04990 [Burkholderiales bacterium]|jgi:hypothetical protein|nr:hypothetical protein [Burkholderiales bacterium]
METKERYRYEVLMKDLRTEVEELAKREKLIPTPFFEINDAIAKRFVIFALGNALAQEKGWRLWGMDAIEYAIISKFSWQIEDVRSLSLRDKWLALHDELNHLTLPEDAQKVWDSSPEAEHASASLEIWGEHPERLDAF